MYRELELGFNLHDDQDVIDQLQISGNPRSVEYAGNGAAFQSELFELGQGGLPMEDLQHEAFAPFMEEAAPRPVAGFAPAYAPGSEADDDEQPGPSRPRAHAVQLYPGGGEGQPRTCYINIPTLMIEPSTEEAGVSGVSQSGPMPLQAKPVPSPNHSQDMLVQLLGPPDDEDNSESNKENKPDTVSEALRSAYAAFVDLDAQQATESDQMEADTASSPTSSSALLESNDSAAVSGTSAPAEVEPAAEVATLAEPDTPTEMNEPPSPTDSVTEDIEPYTMYNAMFEDPRTMSDDSQWDAYEDSERAADETPAGSQEPTECTPVAGPSNRSTEPLTDNGPTSPKPPSKPGNTMLLRSHKR